MLKIGITGGIGSGKSTIARVYEVLGIPVYYADAAARRLMDESPSIRQALQHHFGKESYTTAGLNRKYIANVVFNNPQKLELLNSLTHPATIRDAEEWMTQQHAPYAIKEAALLFESGSAGALDFIIGVSAPRAIRIRRVQERDAISAQEVTARMDRQIDESIKMKLCDFIIYNDDQQMVIPQVLSLHQQLLAISSSYLSPSKG